MSLVNGDSLELATAVFYSQYLTGYNGYSEPTDHLYIKAPSVTETNFYGFMGAAPSIREWVGPRQAKRVAAYDYFIKNKDFEGTIEVDRNKILDNRLYDMAQIMTRFGEAVKRFPLELLYPLMNNGEDAGSLGYDGVPFFSAAHPDPSGGANMSNYTAAGGAPPWYLIAEKPLIYQEREPFIFTAFFDPKDPRVWREKMYEFGVDGRCNAGYGMWQGCYKSRATLDATNLEAALLAMQSYRDDEGNPHGGPPPSILLVPPALQFTAWRLIYPNQEPRVFGSNTAAVTTDNPHNGRLKIIVSRYLDNA